MHRILRCKYLQGGHLYANYREIFRLHSLGLNKTEIASSCWCARNTVAATLQRAANCGLQWPMPGEMSDKQLSERLFPSKLLYIIITQTPRMMKNKGNALTIGFVRAFLVFSENKLRQIRVKRRF